jgi:hypothetical protein
VVSEPSRTGNIRHHRSDWTATHSTLLRNSFSLHLRLCFGTKKSHSSSRKSFMDELAAKIGSGPPKKPVGLLKQVDHTQVAAEIEAIPAKPLSAAAVAEKDAREKMAAIMAGAAARSKPSDSEDANVDK